MTTKEDRNFIHSRSWYQTIEFEKDLISKGCLWCGDPAWSNIKTFLPGNLSGMRVLDLGCNAGLFCVHCAEMGAREVIGVDWTGWRPNWDFQEQQVFVKNYFEKKHNKKFPITYVSQKMEDYVARDDIGFFDYVLAIASIYYTTNSESCVKNITKITDKVILRLRDESRIRAFTTLFERYGFSPLRIMRENWMERINYPGADDFHLYLYIRDIPRTIYTYWVLNGHEELTGMQVPVNIMMLHNEVELSGRCMSGFIEQVPLYNFVDVGSKNVPIDPSEPYTQGSKYQYWGDLIESVKEVGIKTPVIAENVHLNDVSCLKALEGKHRLLAYSSVLPVDLTKTVPTIVVRCSICYADSSGVFHGGKG